MSVTPIAAPTVEAESAGPAAAAQRIQQLQDLIARVETGPAGFAAALQAAQAGTTPAGAAQTAEAQSQAVQTTAAQTLPGGVYPAAAGAGVIPAATGAVAIPTANTVSTTTPVAYTPASTPAPGSSPSGATGSEYDALIEQAAARNGVDSAVLHGLIQQESGFDPNSASSAGALGLTQLMPGTASSLGVTNPLDPAQSIEGGARYLGEMLRQFGGNTEDALAAYNAGPGAVQRYGGVPPYTETQQYVTKVLGYAAQYSQSHPTGVAQPGAAASEQAAIA